MNIPPLPKSLKVAAFDIAIGELSDIEIRPDPFLQGRFSSIDSTLKFRTIGQNKWDVLDSVLHEIGHVIYWAYGIEDDDKEERTVKTMATAWAQIYRDNPEFAEWILKIITPEPEF